MASLTEYARRATTFLLAVSLWIHALFFLNIHLPIISACARLLRLTFSEAVLFALLLALSMLTASGFWKTLGSLAYIYFFPFVPLVYLLYGFFLLLRAVHRWLKRQANLQLVGAGGSAQKTVVIPPVAPRTPDIALTVKKGAPEALRLLARPFKKFALLWGILLLVTNHAVIIWLCVVVILVQLAHKIFRVAKTLFFSEPWLRQIGGNLLKQVDNCLSMLAGVSRDATPNNELRNLWNQVNSYRKISDLLRDDYLLSRWAAILAFVVFGLIYTYFAVLFSFAYYGIGRLNGLSNTWPDWLVSSLFVPLFISAFPKPWELRLLGGLHCILIIAVGVGTIANFLRRKLEAFHKAATQVSDLLRQQAMNEKFMILEEKFSSLTAAALPKPNTEK